MFITLDVVHLFAEPNAQARVRARLAPQQTLTVSGIPVINNGWIWHRVSMPGGYWVPEMRVDGTQAFLQWIGTQATPIPPLPDPVVTPQQPVTANTATNTAETSSASAVASVNDDDRVRTVAFAITARFEGGGYATYQAYDAGVVSYGRFQFTVTGGLSAVLTEYVNESDSDLANALRPFVDRVNARDETLREDKEFERLLKEAAKDPIMQAAQDHKATTSYWDRVHSRHITPRGIKLPLSRALLFDIGINFGVGADFAEDVENENNVPVKSVVGENGITEEQLIKRVAELRRDSHYRQAERDNLPGLKVRGDFWVDLVQKGDWHLQGDDEGNVYVKRRPIQARNPEITLASGEKVSATASTETATTPPTQPTPSTTSAPQATTQQTSEQPVAQQATPAPAQNQPAVPETSTASAKPATSNPTTPPSAQSVSTKPETQASDTADSTQTDTEDTQPKSDSVQERVVTLTPIGTQGVNIRSAASTSASVVGGCASNEIVTLVNPDDASKIGARTWIEVSHPRGFSGYTAAWLFKIVEDTGESTAESDTDTSADPVDTVSVQADKSAQDTPVDDNETTPEISQERVVTLTPIGTQGVNIRSAASTSASVVGGCASNEIVTLVNSDDASKIGARTWIEVSHPKGFSGHTAAWLFKVVEDKLVDIPGSEIDTSSDAETPSTEASAPETDSTADTASTTSTNDERMAARERARSVGNNQSRRSSANASDLALDTSDVSDPLTSDAVSAPVITTQAPAPVTAPVSQTSAPEETASALSTASDFDTGTTGVNLDLYHPLGTPDPAALGGIKWVRFLYNVSMNPDIPEGDDARYGNTDLAATMSRYRPVLEKYAHAKKNIVLVFTHQTYGEGQGLNLGQLDDGQWRTLSDRFAEMVAQIAEQYKDSGIIHALQIWNEQDAHEGAVASIPLRPAVYGYMLGKTIQAVREVDSEIPIITGGHASGPGTGVPYAKATIAAMPDGVRPSGIAFHPYGRGNMKSLQKYRHYGNIDESINSYASVLPDTPLWITEWGVLDAPQSPPEEMGAYAQEFMERVREAHTGKVVSAMWYAWAQGMHNGYGIVDTTGSPRPPFTSLFTGL